MTTRNDIIDGGAAAGQKYGLIYTRRCGWIDLGHASPAGAAELWSKVRSEIGEESDRPGHFLVTYHQSMGNRHIKIGLEKRYAVKKGLSLDEKKSVALAIFLRVSADFEAMQGNWLFRHFTDSSFSAEDLVSNLVGFYRAIDPHVPYIQWCQPVSKDVALELWDRYGAVGSNKNRHPAPYLYPVPGSGMAGPMSAPLPSFLNTITPATPGSLFHELK